MADPQDFVATMQAIISRHPDTLLADRWEEAQSVDIAPDAFWIRESDDLIDIVWLSQHGLADITWFPGSQTGTFNYLPLSSIVDVEIRQGPNQAVQMGLSVSGDLVVAIRASSKPAGLVWVASDDRQNIAELRDFIGQVLKRVAQSPNP